MNTLADAPVAALIVFAVVGVVLAGLLSAGEVAVVSTSRSAAAELIAKNPHKATRLELLMENSVQVASIASFVRIASEMSAAAAFAIVLAKAWDEWWAVLGMTIVFSIVVALVLVRISPRTVGRLIPAKVLGVLSGLLFVTFKSFKWVVPMTRASHTSTLEDNDHELRAFVDRVEDSEAIEEEERVMLRSIMELRETRVSEVMVPRTDMISIESGVALSKATNLFVRSGFSRIPVIGSSADDVLGVLFFKDSARVLLNSSDPDSKTVADVMRPVHFYPEMKPADDLLREMQATHQHIAMAVDEYGGVAGLITVEDILEEIVGELLDEHDNALPGVELISPNKYRVPSRMSLADLGELFSVDLTDPDVDTVAGLLAKTLGRVPLTGAEIEVEGVRIRAEQFTGRRKQLSAVLAEKTQIINDDSEGASDAASAPADTDPSDQRGSGRAEKE